MSQCNHSNHQKYSIYIYIYILFEHVLATIAQLVKRWPTGLGIPKSSPAQVEIFLTVNGVPLHTAFPHHPFHRLDMTEILFKTT